MCDQTWPQVRRPSHPVVLAAGASPRDDDPPSDELRRR